MKFFKKKEEIPPLVWDREEEYQLVYARYIAAMKKLDEALGEGDSNKETILQLETEWRRIKETFDNLYELRQAWLIETGALPKMKQKERLTMDTKVAAGITLLGIALPPLIENRGVILRNASSWLQKPKLWRK